MRLWAAGGGGTAGDGLVGSEGQEVRQGWGHIQEQGVSIEFVAPHSLCVEVDIEAWHGTGRGPGCMP